MTKKNLMALYRGDQQSMSWIIDKMIHQGMDVIRPGWRWRMLHVAAYYHYKKEDEHGK